MGPWHGGGGRWFGPEVGALRNGISAITKRDGLSSAMSGHSKEEGPHQEQALLAP